MKELNVTKVVYYPDQKMLVECCDCCGCDYYHGMDDLNFTLKCGFEDGGKND